MRCASKIEDTERLYMSKNVFKPWDLVGELGSLILLYDQTQDTLVFL